jgi:aminopeptidase N
LKFYIEGQRSRLFGRAPAPPGSPCSALLLLLALAALLLLAVAGCGAVAGAEGVGDPYYPQMGNGGYDALHYTLDLQVDMEANAISGTATLAARATQPLRSFNLDLHGLDVHQVTVNSLVASFSREGDELTVRPDGVLHEGEAFTVTVAYGGVPAPLDDPGMPWIGLGWLRLDSGVYVVSEPSGAMTWFPVNNHPTDKATYTFRITVDEPWVVAANGLLQQQIDRGPARTYVWEADEPMASYLAAVYIAEFERQAEQGPGGLPIRNYFPADATEQATQPFGRTADMIAFFSELFGPYPFDAYGVAVTAEALGLALENQTLSLFGSDMADEDVVAHELAHQWFGDSVTLSTWPDTWLNEGFATYASALWLEHTAGPEALEDSMRRLYSAAQYMPPPGEPPAGNLFHDTVYLRGAWTLHALRLEVGDQAFFQILRTYYDRYEYGNASTGDFIAVAEEVSGRELDAFFDACLFAREAPPPPD